MKKMILVAAPPACGKNYVSELICNAVGNISYFDKDDLNPLLRKSFALCKENVDMDGEFYLENEKPAYYKRRIVRARTPKEAVYKYKQVDASLDISLSCLGEKDNESDYSLNIENDEIID